MAEVHRSDLLPTMSDCRLHLLLDSRLQTRKIRANQALLHGEYVVRNSVVSGFFQISTAHLFFRSVPFDRYYTVYGYFLYFLLVHYIVWGCFHGLTANMSLMLGQSYYLRAIYEDCGLQVKRLVIIRGDTRAETRLLVDIVKLKVQMIRFAWVEAIVFQQF